MLWKTRVLELAVQCRQRRRWLSPDDSARLTAAGRLTLRAKKEPEGNAEGAAKN